MNTTTHLGTVNTLLASVAAGVVGLIEKTEGGAEAKLLVADRIEQELASAEQGILAQLKAARDAAATYAATIRAELNTAAVARVVDLLKAGDLTLETLAARIGAVAPIVVAAPAPAVVAPVAPTNPAIRVNLALQAGYLNDVKYRDENTGLGWSGRGPTPKWLKDLCVNGKTKDDFLVNKPAALAVAPQADNLAPVDAQPVAEVAPVAASVEAPAAPETAPAADAVVEAAPVESGIGEETVVSFDASDIDSDLSTPAGDDEGGSDIEEVLGGIAAMTLPGVSNGSQFLAAA
ncbi:hypothetical protein ABIC83_002860 [Roseateles asaccharophilus]|uniref:H-NS family nucleoid-associated regulatory protein n=1 Tax=Roseateles asaccharophilus TaxID=582607 RepID=UPI003839A04B